MQTHQMVTNGNERDKSVTKRMISTEEGCEIIKVGSKRPGTNASRQGRGRVKVPKKNSRP